MTLRSYPKRPAESQSESKGSTPEPKSQPWIYSAPTAAMEIGTLAFVGTPHPKGGIAPYTVSEARLPDPEAPEHTEGRVL